MKIKIITFLFLGIAYTLSGQTPRTDYDSELSRFLTRHIEYPDYEASEKPGVNLAHISNKNGNLVLETIFLSENKFKLKNIDSLNVRLNKLYNKAFEKDFDLILPIVFSFDMKTDLSKDLQWTVDTIIKKEKKRGYLISQFPFNLIIYEPQR